MAFIRKMTLGRDPVTSSACEAARYRFDDARSRPLDIGHPGIPDGQPAKCSRKIQEVR
jgi:hypothetical protein